jgi:hypothetical protein
MPCAFSTATATPGGCRDAGACRRVPLLHLIAGNDADLGKVDVEERRQHVAVGDKMTSEASSEEPTSLPCSPAPAHGDDPANVADGLPFLDKTFVTEFLKTVRKPKVTAQGAVLPPRTI